MHYINKEELEEVISENRILGNQITVYILTELLSCLEPEHEKCLDANPEHVTPEKYTVKSLNLNRVRIYCETGCDCIYGCHTGDGKSNVEECFYCQVKWQGVGEYADKKHVYHCKDNCPQHMLTLKDERDGYKKALQDILFMYPVGETASYMRDIAKKALDNL